MQQSEPILVEPILIICTVSRTSVIGGSCPGKRKGRPKVRQSVGNGRRAWTTEESNRLREVMQQNQTSECLWAKMLFIRTFVCLYCCLLDPQPLYVCTVVDNRFAFKNKIKKSVLPTNTIVLHNLETRNNMKFPFEN